MSLCVNCVCECVFLCVCNSMCVGTCLRVYVCSFMRVYGCDVCTFVVMSEVYLYVSARVDGIIEK